MATHPFEPDHPTAGSGVPGALAVVGSGLDELAQTFWAARRPGELMDTVATIETLKAKLDAIELQVVAELEATKAVKPTGWASTADFVTAVAGGTKRTGPATVRLAEALGEPLFTPVAEALAQGWLSTTKAHLIHRAVTSLPGRVELRERAVNTLLTEARRLDASGLREVVNRLLTVVDPEGDERRDEKALDRLERSAHLDRHLAVSDDGAGGAVIKGRCSSEDAAWVRATLIPMAAPCPTTGPACDPDTCTTPGCGHDGRDPRDHGARMLDALVELCRNAQTTDLLPDCHGATPRVTVTMDFDDLRGRSGFGTTETGEQLSASAVRRLCCDAEVIPAVLRGDSEVLDLGRTRRLVSPAIWRALVARDAHCRFPRCTRPPVMCHAHHLVHWADGGPTSLSNLILLCGHHHRLIHAGPWQIHATAPGQITFEPPPGRRAFEDHPPTSRPPPDG